MTREEHKKAIIKNLNAMVDKLEDDTEYFDALYHLDMLCKETELKFIAKSDGTIEQIKNCDDCVIRKEWEKPKTNVLDEIKAIIDIPNTIIQEDVLKYKMICEVFKNEGYN